MNASYNGQQEVDTGNLPSLPAGWCWVALSTIAKIDGGITKDQKRRRTASMREVPYLRVANVQRGYLDLAEIKTILADSERIDALRLLKGDILFTEGGDRDKLGRGWVWNDEIEECIHQNHIFRARLQVPLEPKFVSFHGNFFGQEWFTKTGKQTTNLASINKSILSRFPVPVPPLNEQARIVAKIEELFSDLDAGVAALERAKAKLKRYRAAVLKAAVEGKLTAAWRAENPCTEPASELLQRILHERRQKWERQQLAKFAEKGQQPPTNWRGKFKAPAAPNTTDLPDVPKDWCWVTIGAIADVRSGQTPSGIKEHLSTTGDVAWFKVGDMNREGNAHYMNDGADWLSKDSVVRLGLHVHPTGTIIFPKRGGAIATNKKRMLAYPSAYDLNTMGIIPELSLARYVWHWFASLDLATLSDGSNVPQINHDDIEPLPIALPPLSEQQEIVTELEQRISLVEQAEKQISIDLKRATRLRLSILRRAFEGKLVPQDPADEPASKLLERIPVERENSSATRTGRQRKKKVRKNVAKA